MRTHTYAICAYKESPYLEECIQSIKQQTIQSEILIATSTPNDYIRQICEKYKIMLCINDGEKGITQDWNFAYEQAKTELVTIAHQDDIYFSNYTDEIFQLQKKAKDALILFTDYSELRNNQIVSNNKLLCFKRVMLYPLRYTLLWKSRIVRRCILAFGNPICCPAVTYVKENLPVKIFKDGFRSNEDWEAWEMLSKLEGSFAYSKKVCMCHRIHEGSETSAIIGDNERTKEDYIMYSKFWPRPIAKLLTKFYALSEKSNELK